MLWSFFAVRIKLARYALSQQVALPSSFTFLCDAGAKNTLSIIFRFSFPFFLAPPKKEAKKLSGSTYVLGVRSRSYVSLAVVHQMNVFGRHDRVSKLASLRLLKQLTQYTHSVASRTSPQTS